MIEIGLMGGEKIKLKGNMDEAILTDWLNDLCDSGVKFALGMKPDGKVIAVRVSEISTVSEL